MKILVQKFGGTSVADPEKVRKVARIAVSARKQGYAVAVVASAPGDMTDDLIDYASAVSKKIPDREMDMLMAIGEQKSIASLAMALAEMGQKAVSFTGEQAGILTDGIFGKARILRIDPSKVLKALKEGSIAVVAGFQGVDRKGEITTLGRGGSDTTAVALAVAIKADMCDIYTDVKGVFTSDPRVVQGAKRIRTISYDEALEMTSLGAKVLHPRSAEIAKVYGLKVRVRSSFNPGDAGTLVFDTGSGKKLKIKTRGEDMERTYVVSATADKNQAKVTVVGVPDRPGIVSKIFSPIAKGRISVDVIVQNVSHKGHTDVSFTISRVDLSRTMAIVKKVAKELRAQTVMHASGVAKVSIVGAGMYSYPGVAAKMFTALAKKGINIEMISTSEIKISCVVEEKDADNAVRALNREFRLGKK